MVRGSDLVDDVSLPKGGKDVDLPTLLVIADKDYCTRPYMQKHSTGKWVKQLRIEELNCGHWLQLELPEKLTQLLEGFADELSVL